MTNEIIYTNIELDEVALGGEVFKKAREFSSGGSPISAPQSQSTTSNRSIEPISVPQSQSTTSNRSIEPISVPQSQSTTSNRSIDYKNIIPVLQSMMFDKNKLKSFDKKTKQKIYNEIETLIKSLKTKSPETFVMLEQQKVTNRTTIDLSKIIGKYNLQLNQKNELKQFIIDFVKNINSSSVGTKFIFLDKATAKKSSPYLKSISEIERLINEIGKATLFQNWKNIFNKLLSFIDQKVVNEDMKSKIIRMYNYINLIKNTPPLVPDKRFYTYMTNDILTPLGFNDDQIKIILYSFKKCLENYFIDKNKVESEIKEINSFVPLHIDFSKSKQLNESFLRMFGTAIEMIVGRMFGQDVQLPYLTISGSPQQMQALTDTLSKEKRYVDSYVKYGLDDPRTYQDQYKLQNAINNFERETGIKWPIK